MFFAVIFCIWSVVDENLEENTRAQQAGGHKASVFCPPPWVPPLSPDSQTAHCKDLASSVYPEVWHYHALVFAQFLPAPDPAEIPGRFGQSDGTVGAEPFPEEPEDPCKRSKESECELFTFSALLYPEWDALLLCWGVETSILMVESKGQAGHERGQPCSGSAAQKSSCGGSSEPERSSP